MRVNKAFAEAEWPTKQGLFGGDVKISFENEDENGMADLVVEGASVESVAYSIGQPIVPMAVQKPDRPAVAEDFIDHGQERLTEARDVKANEVGAGSKGKAVETEKAAKPKAAAKK